MARICGPTQVTFVVCPLEHDIPCSIGEEIAVSSGWPAFAGHDNTSLIIYISRVHRKTEFRLILPLLLAVSACGPSGGEHGGHGGFGMHHLAAPLLHRGLRMGLREARPRGFRRACEQDVAKLCPNISSRRQQRQCLEGKRGLLSADCRAAMDRRREHGNERGGESGH
ncbi:MAG TPA: hypothetical protein VHY79_10005 [Rhizomicrobium sp.]|jgi:hypothetical protein|nr:hypothetical protein [Rhizomicrobium sp.]